MMYVTRTGGDEAQQNMPEIFQTAQVTKIEKAELVAPAPAVTKFGIANRYAYYSK